MPASKTANVRKNPCQSVSIIRIIVFVPGIFALPVTMELLIRWRNRVACLLEKIALEFSPAGRVPYYCDMLISRQSGLSRIFDTQLIGSWSPIHHSLSQGLDTGKRNIVQNLIGQTVQNLISETIRCATGATKLKQGSG